MNQNQHFKIYNAYYVCIYNKRLEQKGRRRRLNTLVVSFIVF